MEVFYIICPPPTFEIEDHVWNKGCETGLFTYCTPTKRAYTKATDIKVAWDKCRPPILQPHKWRNRSHTILDFFPRRLGKISNKIIVADTAPRMGLFGSFVLSAFIKRDHFCTHISVLFLFFVYLNAFRQNCEVKQILNCTKVNHRRSVDEGD